MESPGKKRGGFSSDDEPSPRGVLEIPISGTESDHSASSSSSLSSPGKLLAAAERQGQQWKAMIETLRKKSMQRISTIPLLVSSYDISRSLRKRRIGRFRSAEDTLQLGGIPTKPSWRNFDYEELQAATDDFSPGMNNHNLLFFFHNQFPSI